MPTPTEIATLQQVKRHANITTSVTNDGELDMIRLAAEELVEGLIGPVIWRTVIETLLRATVDGDVWLSTTPVVSVTSFTSSGIAVTGYTLDADWGRLRKVSAYGDLSVTYVAGRSTVPASVKLATCIIATHLWQTQRGNAPGSALPDDERPAGFFGIGFAIPARAMDLLAPHLRRSLVL